MTKIMLKTFLVLAAFGFFMLPAHADQIYFCQPSLTQNCKSAPGGTAIGGESNLITNTGAFDVDVAGAASHDLSPTLIIVAEFDGIGGTPSISFSGCAVPSACPVASLGTYGLKFDTKTITSGDPFHVLGLTSGGSIQFGNFAGEDELNGFGTPTSFTLYAFSLPTGLVGEHPITIDESGAAPGSFILGYSCKVGATFNSSGMCHSGKESQTVDTNSGLLAPGGGPHGVPESSSLGLLGLGLLSLAVFTLRRPAANLI